MHMILINISNSAEWPISQADYNALAQIRGRGVHICPSPPANRVKSHCMPQIYIILGVQHLFYRSMDRRSLGQKWQYLLKPCQK